MLTELKINGLNCYLSVSVATEHRMVLVSVISPGYKIPIESSVVGLTKPDIVKLIGWLTKELSDIEKSEL